MMIPDNPEDLMFFFQARQIHNQLWDYLKIVGFCFDISMSNACYQLVLLDH